MTKGMVSLVLLAAGVGLFGCEQREYEGDELTRAGEPVVADPYASDRLTDDQVAAEPIADEPFRAEDPYGTDDPYGTEDELRVEPVGGLEDEEGLRQVGRDRTRARDQVHTPPATTEQPGTHMGTGQDMMGGAGHEMMGSTEAKQGVAMLHSSEGEKAGTVRLTEQDGTVTMKAELTNVASLQGGATVRIAEHGDCDRLMGGDEAKTEAPTAETETTAEATATETTAADETAEKDLASTEITFEGGQMTAEQKLTGVGFQGAESVIGHAVVIETKGETAETYCGVVGIDRK